MDDLRKRISIKWPLDTTCCVSCGTCIGEQSLLLRLLIIIGTDCNHWLLRMDLAHVVLRLALVQLFTSHFSHIASFLGRFHTLKWHPVISEQPCWQSSTWMETPTISEEKMWCHFFSGSFVCHWFFCFALCSAHLQAQFQLYQTWHLWCNSNSQTGEGRNAVVHMLRAPLCAGAKPIIHVEICLGKLGSTLENKQPETGELHWCFRATLMSCRLMEACRHTAKASFFFFSCRILHSSQLFSICPDKMAFRNEPHSQKHDMSAVGYPGIHKLWHAVVAIQVWSTEITRGGEDTPEPRLSQSCESRLSVPLLGCLS